MTPPRKPRGGNRNPNGTSSRTAIRDAQALRLYASGLDTNEVAQRTGYANRSGAWKAIQRAIAAQQAVDVETIRARENTLIQEIRKRQIANALRGDVKAYDAVLRGHDRIARLYSLEQPADHDAVSEARSLLDNIADQIAAMPDTYEDAP